MANPDGNPNPNIAEAGKDTRFGQPNAPARGGDKAWSIRNQVRYLVGQPVDITEEKPFEKILKDIPKPTGAQLIAARALDKAAQGDARLVEYATDNIDGKLIQPNLNADLERIKNMSEEEIDAELARIDRELEGIQAGTQDGSSASIEGDSSSQTETETI